MTDTARPTFAQSDGTAQSDAEAISLGNLATVEFDLDLPTTGRRGSRITWRSSDDRWLDDAGRVRRPVFGRGNRKVTLTATVTNGDATATREFHVTVLQQPYRAAIESVPPVRRRIVVSPGDAGPRRIPLPSWGAAVTGIGAIAVPLQWPEPEAVIDVPSPSSTSLSSSASSSSRRFVVDGHTGAEPSHPVQAVIDVVIGHDDGNGVDDDIDADHSNGSPTKPTLRGIPLTAIRFGERSVIGHDQRLRRDYLRSLDNDRLLYAFRAAAGLDTRGAEPMTGWDSPDCLLRGHTTGHVLSAYALCAQSTGDEQVRGKLAELVHGLAEVQRAFARRPDCHPGFLSAYDERQFDDLERLVPYPDVWAPYYTLHKIIAGLIDAYETGVDEALPVVEGIGRWVVDRLGRLDPRLRQRMWGTYIAGEFGGMNESMARLAGIVRRHAAMAADAGDDGTVSDADDDTDAARFLDAARWFDNDRLLEPLRQHVDALDGMHANQHIPQVIGHLAIAERTGDAAYLRTSERFWHEVMASHMYAVGGVGQGEMFRTSNVIAALLDDDTAETCATYNLIKLAAGLRDHGNTFDGIHDDGGATVPSPEYGDYIELALRNHIAASIDRSAPNGGSTYFLPTRPAGRKSFDLDGDTCCHGTGLEAHFRAGDGALLVDDRMDAVHIQLLESMRVDSPDDGIAMRIDVADETPNVVHIRIDHLTAATLRVRVPWWALGRAFPAFDDADDGESLPTDTIVTINGRRFDDVDYDAVAHELVFPVKQLDSNPLSDIIIRFPIDLGLVRTPDDIDVASVMWGPYVLAALAGDNDHDERGGGSSNGHASGEALTPAMPHIVVDPDDVAASFARIPPSDADHPVAFAYHDARGGSLRFEPIAQIPADVPYHLYCRIGENGINDEIE
ncbi:glycoside hydrolase family 127 protein [Bifidobacterium sp. 82T24]|uniref:beta-L-arabinofuranosidase domain-containing protein n=1 Tax=Bifidobacterium pluvialisilvae TaxID=2834436 RepID=UPI001C579913|nr:beta-L-arabinofuranosidase domain-containing protein [Bifidobacterium pluvialisilvae]MBW3087979.1 glycoside hydrolase family 127 protein [Bifidobacterium pluvialisilvae]